ncbi:MAG: aldehyde dehydrogenase family protein, partial [Gammaproteobacteria bacterium]
MNKPETLPIRDQLEALLARQIAASREDGLPPAAVRIDRMRRLESVLRDHQKAWCEALDADFAGRPVMQSRMEIFSTIASLQHACKHVHAWMKPERRPLPLIQRLTGARAEVFYQPLGVVGVVAPWNFPLVLSIGALASVFAAGNRAMLKPSELAPHSSALMKELLDRA